MTRLGLYFLDWRRKDLAFSGGWAAIKFHLPADNYGDLEAARRANPNALLVGRLNPGKTHAMGLGYDLCGASPEQLGELLERWALPLKQRGLIDAVMGKNECNDPENYARTDAALAPRMAAHGLHYLGSAWSYGNTPASPRNPAEAPYLDWRWYEPALRAGSWVNEHTYSSSGEDLTWTGHRHRIWWPRLPLQRPVFFGEYNGPQGHLPVEAMIDYDRHLQAHDHIVACCIFSVGTDGNARWDPFDIGRDGRGERLAAYVRQNPAQPWRPRVERYLAGAPQTPQTPPPQPPAYRVIDFRPKVPDAEPFPARSREDIQRIVVHHTATCPHQPEARCRPWEELIQEVDRFHRSRLGLAGYPFHYTASPEPAWYYTGELLSVRPALRDAGSGDQDRGSIHVALLGNYQSHPPSERLLAMLAERVQLLRTWLKRPLPLVPHEELDPGCACPGPLWSQWRQALERGS